MKEQKKFKISKEHAEMFKNIVGDTSNASDIEITEKENIMKDMLNKGDTPPGLKIVESIFNYICNFFSIYVPITILIGLSCDYIGKNAFDVSNIFKYLAPNVFKTLAFSVISFCVIKIVEFFISCFLIAYYSKVLDKTYKQAKAMEDKIKEKVDGKEENTDSSEPKVGNSNDAAFVFNNIVSGICREAVMDKGMIPMDLTDLKQNVSAILYNIFKTNSMPKVKDRDFSEGIINGTIYDESLFEHASNKKEDQLYAYKCIYKAGIKTNWFTK